MIYHGDCIEILKTLAENSVDSIVTDPPYGWRFMGKAWDHFDVEKMISYYRTRPPRMGSDGSIRQRGTNDRSLLAGSYDFSQSANHQFQLWTEQWAKEALRVLKPGGHMLVFCGPRTYHRMASGVEDAGFEIRDQLQWLFGSGFPKSMDISKAIDKQFIVPEQDSFEWKGWGTALKPANEPILLARKPISEKTVAANVLKFGTGGINIDASRIGYQSDSDMASATPQGKVTAGKLIGMPGQEERVEFQRPELKGRFPSNLIFSHNPDCVEVGTKKVKAIKGGNSTNVGNQIYGKYAVALDSKPAGFGDADGTETVAAFECTPDCAVAALDEQSGNRKSSGHYAQGEISNTAHFGNSKSINNAMYSDSGGASRFFKTLDGCTEGCAVAALDEQSGPCKIGGVGIQKADGFNPGKNHIGKSRGLVGNHRQDNGAGGASRFFYVAKTSKSERNAGCEEMPEKAAPDSGRSKPAEGRSTALGAPRANHHPTVKPKKLMSYLINLITPPDGIVLDPFVGSGSTGVACAENGFQFIGIEKEKEYFGIAEQRISHASEQSRLDI